MSLVAARLKEKGETVNFSSFDHAVGYLEDKGFHCDRVAPIDVKWSEGEVSAGSTFRHAPTLFSNFTQQVRQERRIIERFRPDVVISDTRLSAVVAAYLSGVSSLTVTNQIRILLPPPYHATSLRRIEGVVAETLGLLWARSRLTLIPDLPPPYTISERNTRGVRTLQNKVRHVGFMAPVSEVGEERVHKVSDMLVLGGGKPTVFAQISGPPEANYGLMETVLEAAETLSDRFVFVISEGKVGGDDKPRRVRGSWVFEWCPFKDELFYAADLLVVRGGHTTLSQAIMHGKPVVTIPIKNHSEQAANASKIVRMGVGVAVDPYALTSRSLVSAVETVFGDDAFRRRILEVREVARRLDGVRNTVDIVKTLLL